MIGASSTLAQALISARPAIKWPVKPMLNLRPSILVATFVIPVTMVLPAAMNQEPDQ